MVCVDTTYLVDLWRTRDQPDATPKDLLNANPGTEFVVPAHAAGEFLEGGAAVSPERLAESLAFLRLFRVGDVDVETAHRYATIVAGLRHGATLVGRSKPNLSGSRPGRSSTPPPSPPETPSTSVASQTSN